MFDSLEWLWGGFQRKPFERIFWHFSLEISQEFLCTLNFCFEIKTTTTKLLTFSNLATCQSILLVSLYLHRCGKLKSLHTHTLFSCSFCYNNEDDDDIKLYKPNLSKTSFIIFLCHSYIIIILFYSFYSNSFHPVLKIGFLWFYFNNHCFCLHFKLSWLKYQNKFIFQHFDANNSDIASSP